ncbi:hypothetical protein BDQ17DRAFT_1382264 [Cyathus striatus]|nr:hypothetical protein BDQ17DRAFT_1382264 [Cyathus striatus]
MSTVIDTILPRRLSGLVPPVLSWLNRGTPSLPLQALLKLSILFKSRKEKVDSVSPLGRNPLDMVVNYKSTAGLDDCDFYGHMSNSSYAKTLDAVRFKAAIIMFPRIFAPGGWIALGETHYHFIREIPILSPYEVRLSIASWDHKWIHIVCKFVTKPKRKPNRPYPQSSNSTLLTPSESGTNKPAISESGGTTPNLKSLSKIEEPDGAIINAITISVCCFKIGRITIPPAVVMALNGFCAPAPSPVSGTGTGSTSTSTSMYSHSNPPLHWPRVHDLMCCSRGGSTRKLALFLRGGWKDVKEGDRWWDSAFGGVEERRIVGLEVFEGVRKGMDFVRSG